MLTSLEQYYQNVEVAADFVKAEIGLASIAIVLGSGLSGFTNQLQKRVVMPYKDIPNMPTTSVPGNPGELVSGELPLKCEGAVKVMCFAGRIHHYEGYTFEQVNFQVRLAAACGCSILIATNNAGGAIDGLVPGSAVVIRDHIRMTHVDPLRSVALDSRLCPPKLNLDNMYSERLAKLAMESADRLGQKLFEGTYCWTLGPTYETPAEARAGIQMGGSVFGMSTVPEVIAGYALGMTVFGISLCTCLASGILAEKLFHSDVIHVAEESGPKFEALIVDMIYHLDMESFTKAAQFLHTPMGHDVSTVEIMQRYPDWSGSEQVNPDAETLQRALFGDGCPELAIFANTGPVLQKLIVRMETMKSFSFSDLEQLCNLSPMAADKGNIFTGTFSDGFRVLVVEQTFKEGLFDFESHHIVGILCKIGVLSVIQIVESHIGRMETDAFIVDEIIDVTRDKLYPGSGFPRVNFKGSHIDEYCHGPLCVFPGPLMPSASERNLVEAVAAGAYTCTSLSTTYCAIQSGLKCDVIAVTKNDPNLELLPLINAIRAFHEQSSKRNSIWEGQVPAVKRYIFQQENLADVNFAASELKGALISDRGSTTIALVVDSALADTVADVKWFANVPVEAVQGWSQEFAQNWQLGFGEWANHKRVIFLYSSRRSPQNYAAPLSNATFAIRVLKKLGIEQVIFLGQARSCSDELPVDTIAIVADHVNFSGENPLCGTNVDEFGVQFPDLSDAYRKVGNHPCRAIVAYTPNLIATSAKLGESLGCSAFCETLIPEIIAARHASMAVTAIIWISSTFSDSNREQESVPHSVCQGIKTLIDEILAEDIGSNQPIDTRD